jgi:signal transduction histidine kinase
MASRTATKNRKRTWTFIFSPSFFLLAISEAPLRPIVESAARTAGLDGDPRLRMMLANDLVIRGDAMRLRQVVLNILSNAARYTPTNGRITIKASRRDEEVVVEVHNTGSDLRQREN